MSYTVTYTKSAKKQLAKLDLPRRLLILTWIDKNLEGCEVPRSVPNGKALVGVKNGWRWRIGTYRVLATINDAEIEIAIFKLGHRSNVYEQL
jgi:mRNA interferase RelE/StbE